MEPFVYIACSCSYSLFFFYEVETKWLTCPILDNLVGEGVLKNSFFLLELKSVMT